MNLTRAVVYLLTSSFAKQKALKIDLSWLRDVCNATLARMLTGQRPDGLHALLSIFIDQPNVEDVAFFKAAQLISSVPRGFDPEFYISRLAPQLLDELRIDSKETDNHPRAAAIIVGVMVQRHAQLALRHILHPVCSAFQPYISLFTANATAIEDTRGRQNEEKEARVLEVKTPLFSTLRLQPSPAAPRPLLIEEIGAEPNRRIEIVQDSPMKTHPAQKPANRSSSLLSLAAPFARLPEAAACSSAADLLTSISDLHRLCIKNPNPLLLELLTPVMPALLDVYMAGSQPASLISEISSIEKSEDQSAETLPEASGMAREVFLLFLGFAPRTISIRLLLYLIFENHKIWTAVDATHMYSFEVSPGMARLTRKPQPRIDESSFVSEAIRESRAIVDLLKALASAATTQSQPGSVPAPDLLGDLFVQLLVQFVSAHESSHSQSVGENARTMTALQVLLGMSESLGENVLSNVVQVCLFVQSMLRSEDTEIQSLAMTILDMMTQESKVKLGAEEVDVLLVEMLTPLRLIEHESTDETIRAFSKQLHSRITEMIAANSTARISRAKGAEQLFNPSAKQSVEAPHSASVQEAIADIASPIAPIRAGGLIQLRRFLLEQNKEAISQIPSILKIFGDNLSNEDSYVYLGAIQGLSAVGDIQLSAALPYIRSIYSSASQKVEIRLKIGEAILQIAQRLGDALTIHSAELYGLIVPVLRDDDATMRASALSNVAQFGELLGFGIKPYIQEILSVIYDVLLAETEIEVRRAACNAVYQIVHGLDTRIFDVLPNDITRLRSLLEALANSDKDDVTRFLAKVAADEIYETVVSTFQTSLLPASFGNETLEAKLRFV